VDAGRGRCAWGRGEEEGKEREERERERDGEEVVEGEGGSGGVVVFWMGCGEESWWGKEADEGGEGEHGFGYLWFVRRGSDVLCCAVLCCAKRDLNRLRLKR